MLKLCDDIDTMAMTLLDGELAEQELRDMDLHLLSCGSCKAHVERERAAHQLRRQRLAAPPAPALVRARLHRALDEVDRAQRPSRRGYLLPVGAALAAVAALVVFVTAAGPTAQRPAGLREASTTGDRVTGRPPLSPVVEGGRLTDPRGWSVGDVKFQRSGHQFLDRRKETAMLYYAVLTPDGDRLSLQAAVGDADALGLDPGQASMVGGFPVWLDDSGLVAVRDGKRGIILSSSTLNQRDLVALVAQSLIVMRIGADDPRP